MVEGPEAVAVPSDRLQSVVNTTGIQGFPNGRSACGRRASCPHHGLADGTRPQALVVSELIDLGQAGDEEVEVAPKRFGDRCVFALGMSEHGCHFEYECCGHGGGGKRR